MIPFLMERQVSRDRELWNITVEIEASKLAHIASTLDLEHYNFQLGGQQIAEAKALNRKMRLEKAQAKWFAGEQRNPKFNMRNGFGRTTKNR